MLTVFHVVVGVDARKAVADGFPLQNVVTTDLKNGKPSEPGSMICGEHVGNQQKGVIRNPPIMLALMAY